LGVKVKQLELTVELVKYGIIDIYYNNEKIEIMFTDKNGKEDIITLAVLKNGTDSIKQLDSLVNGSMSVEAFTFLKHYLELKLTPIWDQIYVSTSSDNKGKGEERKKKQELNRDYEFYGRFEWELTQKHHFKSLKDTKEIYYYEPTKGIYIKDAEWLIEQECIRSNPMVTTTDVNDTKNRIIWSNYTDRTEFDADIEWLCCKNVMINLVTGEAKEHSPDFMATVQIPQVYLHRTPHVPLPYKILNFLHEVMASNDDVEMVLDFIAYCLWRGFPFHRWLLFNGSGRNGKGVTTELITRFLGYENVSNETLHRLLSNNFASAGLYGKMANIDADLSSDELKQTGTLKKLTGNDWIAAEHKFKPPFHFKNHAKLIFSANKMPITPDESDAFFARPLIINFPNQYLGDKANPYLIDELTTPEEMSCLLSLVLKRLPRVLKAGTSSQSTIEDNYTKYMQSSDPIRLFSELCIKTVLDVKDFETKEAVYNAYQNFCIDKKLPKESSETFSRRLKEIGFDYKQRKIEGVKTHVWIQVGLRDYKEAEKEQDTLEL
jgi:P4 family phage/plasmid primase-like protien